MIKKIILIIIFSVTLIYLFYNAIYSYRIIAIFNDGNLKYKEGTRLVTFSGPPFSIINPFKKTEILNKILEYCKSGQFDSYHRLNSNKLISTIDYFDYKDLYLQNSIIIEAVKDEEDTVLILVADKTRNDSELVFILDVDSNKIVGYF